MPKIPIDTQKKISSEFQKRIAELIEDSDFTKKEFAEKIGLSYETVSRMTIYGIIPSLKTLLKIADYYNISLPYLLAETDDNLFYGTTGQADFQSRLQALMKERNVKYSKIAKSMPFRANYFNEWEREGTLPSLEYLKAIAEYFNVSCDYLLGRTDDKS